MQKLQKIFGSVITSFLFIILTSLILTQLMCTITRFKHKDLSSLIDKDKIFRYVTSDMVLTNDEEKIVHKYTDEYINYVFYKRSYPTISYSDINFDDKFIKNMEIIKDKIDLEYKQVIIIRRINNFVSNNSIYFMLNISIISAFLIICLKNKSLIKGIYILGISLIISGLFSLIGITIVSSLIYKIKYELLKSSLRTIIKSNLINFIFKMDLIYFGIGLIIYVIFYMLLHSSIKLINREY